MNILVSTLALLVVFVLLLTVFKGVGLGVLFNWEALMIILGGTAAGLLIGYPIDKLKATFKAVLDSFNLEFEREKTIENILAVARLYRKSEVRSLERMAGYIDDSMMRLGINLLINYHRSEDIRAIMEREVTSRLITLQGYQNVLKTAARLAPSLGLAGTVISLIKMFGQMSTAEAMMPLMAVALMSTFYGVIISNLIFMPLNAKLKYIADSMEEELWLTIEGIDAIHKGEHPLRIEERLRGGWLYGDAPLVKLNHIGSLATEGAYRGRL